MSPNRLEKIQHASFVHCIDSLFFHSFEVREFILDFGIDCIAACFSRLYSNFDGVVVDI